MIQFDLIWFDLIWFDWVPLAISRQHSIPCSHTLPSFASLDSIDYRGPAGQLISCQTLEIVHRLFPLWFISSHFIGFHWFRFQWLAYCHCCRLWGVVLSFGDGLTYANEGEIAHFQQFIRNLLVLRYIGYFFSDYWGCVVLLVQRKWSFFLLFNVRKRRHKRKITPTSKNNKKSNNQPIHLNFSISIKHTCIYITSKN